MRTFRIIRFVKVDLRGIVFSNVHFRVCFVLRSTLAAAMLPSSVNLTFPCPQCGYCYLHLL
jgi:hypothetical protein